MHKEDLIRDQMTMKLDLGAGRELFVSHYEVRRPAILTVDLDDERPLPSVPTDATLSLAGL